MSSRDNTRYIISLVLQARDEMNAVLRGAREEVQGFSKDAEKLDKDLDAVGKKISSINTRAKTAANGINALRQQTSDLREAVKEFKDSEGDLSTAIDAAVTRMGRQSRESEEKRTVTREVVVEVDKATEAEKKNTKAVVDNTAAAEKHNRTYQEAKTKAKEAGDSLGELTQKYDRLYAAATGNAQGRPRRTEKALERFSGETKEALTGLLRDIDQMKQVRAAYVTARDEALKQRNGLLEAMQPVEEPEPAPVKPKRRRSNEPVDREAGRARNAEVRAARTPEMIAYDNRTTELAQEANDRKVEQYSASSNFNKFARRFGVKDTGKFTKDRLEEFPEANRDSARELLAIRDRTRTAATEAEKALRAQQVNRSAALGLEQKDAAATVAAETRKTTAKKKTRKETKDAVEEQKTLSKEVINAVSEEAEAVVEAETKKANVKKVGGVKSLAEMRRASIKKQEEEAAEAAAERERLLNAVDEGTTRVIGSSSSSKLSKEDTDLLEDDDEAPEFPGIPGFSSFGGGAPSKRDKELAEERKAIREREANTLVKQIQRYTELAIAVNGYLKQLRAGKIDEDEFNARQKGAVQTLNSIISATAKLTTLGKDGEESLRRFIGAGKDLAQIRKEADEFLAENRPVEEDLGLSKTRTRAATGHRARKDDAPKIDPFDDPQRKDDTLRYVVELHDRYLELRKQLKDGTIDQDRAVAGFKELATAMAGAARQERPGTQASTDYRLFAEEMKREAALYEQADTARERSKQASLKRNAQEEERVAKETAAALKRVYDRADQQRERDQQAAIRKRSQDFAAGQARQAAFEREAAFEENERRDKGARNEGYLELSANERVGARELSGRLGPSDKIISDDQRNEIDATIVSLQRLRAGLVQAQRENVDNAASYQRFGSEVRQIDNILGDFNDRLRAYRAEQRILNRDTNGIIGTFERWHRAIQRNSDGLSTLDNKLQGLLVLGVMAFADQLITALTSLVGALGAVAASAASAAAAIGGVFTAALAQAGPVIGVVAAAALRLKDIFDVMKQADLVDEQKYQRADNAAKKRADTTDAVANAQDGLVAANEGLEAANEQLAKSHEAVAEAQDGVGEAQVNLAKARKEAIRQIRDLIQAEREAELAAKGAALSQEEAQEALRRAIASGDVEGIKRAELGLEEADQGVNSAQNNLDDARAGRRQAERGVNAQDNVKDAKEGVKDAKKNVVDARKAVDDAEKGVEKARRSVERAERGIDKARRGADAAAEDNFAAASKLEYLLAQLSPAERKLYDAIQRIKETYKEVMRPITDIVVGELAEGVDAVEERLRDKRIQRSLRGVATGIAESMRSIRKEFNSGPIVDQMIRITDESKKNLKPVTGIVTNLGKAFLNIAEAAGPSLNRVLRYFEDLSDEILGMTRDTDSLEKFFDGATDSLILFFDAIKGTINLLAALTVAGKPTGDSILKDYTDYVNNLAKSTRTNDKQVQQFFRDAKEGLYTLLPLLPALGKAIVEVFDPERMKPLVEFLTDTVLPALTEVIQIVGAITSAILTILNLPGFSQATGFIIGILLLNKVMRGTAGLLEGIIKSLLGFTKIGDRISSGKLSGFLGGLATGFGKVSTKLGDLLKRIPLIGTAFTRMGDKATAAGRAAQTSAAAAATAAGGGGQGVVGGRRGQSYVDPDTGEVIPAGDPRNPGGAQSTRRARALKGVGVTALLGGGAYAMTQQDTKSLRDAAGIKSGDQKGAFGSQNNFGLGQLGGALGQLTSFDFNGLGGSIKGMFKGSEPLTKFAKDFGKNLDNLTKKRDTKGLEELRDKAKDLSTQYPKFADALKEAADQADNNARTTKDLNKRLDDTQDVTRKLRKQGINIDVKVRTGTAKVLLEDLNYYLDALKKGIPTTLGQLRRDVADQIDRIRAVFTDDQGIRKNGFYEAMAETTRAQIKNLDRLKREGKITAEQYNRDMRGMRRNVDLFSASLDDAKGIGIEFGRRFEKSKKPVAKTIDGILNELDKMPIAARRAAAAQAINLARETDKGRPAADKAAKRLSVAIGKRWRGMRDLNVERSRQLVSGTATSFNNAPGLLKGPLEALNKTVNGVLRNYGAKPVSPEVNAPKGGIIALSKAQLSRFLGDAAGGAESDATGGIVGRRRFSAAGIVGREGERGQDDVPAWIGRGEMVLNAGHQRYIAPAVEAFYGHPLGKTFQRIRGFHRGGYADGFSGFASGGYPNGGLKGAGGGFDPLMRYLNSKFGPIYVMSGSRPGSRVAGSGRLSNHSGGNAVDITAPGIEQATEGNPPKGAVGARMDRLDSFMRRYIHPKIGLDHLWRTMQGGNHYNHIHQGVKAEYNKSVGKMRKFLSGLPEGGDYDGGTGDPGEKPAKLKSFTVTGRGAQRRLIQRALNQIQKGAQAKINRAWKKAADAAYIQSGSSAGNSLDGISGDGGTAGENQKLGKKMMLAFGFGSDQWPALRTLWQGESGWRTTADNPTSDAYGIPQALPGSKMSSEGSDWKTSAKTQIAWGLKYIKGRYKTPRGALDFWNSKSPHWYSGGGIVGALLGGLPQFATGGEIHGEDGAPTPVLAHAGEWILNKRQQLKMSKMLGMSRDVLKAAMGFSGSNAKGFAGGGEISDTQDAVNREYSSRGDALRRKAARSGIYDLPVLPIEDWAEVITEIRRATRALKLSSRSWKARVRAINSTIKEIRDDTTDAQDTQIAALKRGGVTAKERKKIADIEARMTAKEEREVKELRRERELLEKGIGKTRAQRLKSRRDARREAQRDEVYNTVNEISKEGGLYDTATQEREREASRRKRAGIFARLKVSGAGVVTNALTGDDREVREAATALDDARDNLGKIEEQRKLITRAMSKTKARLKQLKGGKGGLTKDESAEARKLETQLARLRNQFGEIRDAEAEGVTSVYEAQIAEQQAVVDRINKGAERASAANDIKRRIATSIGDESAVAQYNNKQLEILDQQKNDLQRQLTAASNIGNTELVRAIQDQITDLDTTIKEGVQQALRDSVDAVNKSFDRRNRYIDMRKRVASALGNTGAVQALDQETRQSNADQIVALTDRLNAARAKGNVGLAQELEDQIAELRTSAVELTASYLRGIAENINTRAQEGIDRADYFGRAADVFGKLGLDGAVVRNGETMTRRAGFAMRGNAMQQQRGDLSNLLMQTMLSQPENVGLIKDLTKQIADLDLSIQENSKALFDARVEDVNARTARITTLLDLDAQIATLKGDISGVTDNAALLGIANSRQSALAQQRAELEKLLAEAVASGNEEGQQSLTEQLKQNEIASLENTKTIRDLTGATLQPQTYSSAYWREFQQALYDGMGNILPQYDISPGGTNALFKTGAYAPDGSDPIVPAYAKTMGSTAGVKEGDINIEINEAGGDIDETRLAATIAFAKKTIQR